MPQRKQRRPTIVDIAEEVGVSKSLVSLALRNGPGVKKETRDRILVAAKEMGYHVNHQAQSLVSGKSSMLGVVVTDLENPYATKVLNAIEDGANDRGLDIIIGHGRRNPDTIKKKIDQMIHYNVSGVVLVSGYLSTPDITALGERIPLVVVGRYDDLDSVSTVSNHDEAGSRLAISHLYDLGHRSIAFVSKSRRNSAIARRDTALHFGGDLGIEMHSLQIESSDHEGLRKWLLSDERPTAIFCNNDMTALTVLGEARALGIRVPEDLSVMGYDDSMLARVTVPTLSTIGQPLSSIGEAAVNALTRCMDHPEERAEHIRLEPYLVERESTSASNTR